MAGPRATLLFAHGTGFCPGIWNPVIKRLKQAPLVQRVAPDMVTFDFPYHGPRRDVSVRPTIHLEYPESPRVSHPAMHWAEWAPEEVVRQVKKLRGAEAAKGSGRAPLIGIGHSLGAAAMWKTEALNPGTFDGLILFEPMLNVEEFPNKGKWADFLVAITLQRRASWCSFEEAKADFLSMRNFAKWHPEALEGYIDGVVVKVSPVNNVLDPESKYALSCHPQIEASIYSGDPPTLNDDQVASVRCPVTFQYGSRSQLFFPELRQRYIDMHPDIYRMAEPIPDGSHVQVMEDPDTSASRILDCLEQLSPFASDC